MSTAYDPKLRQLAKSIAKEMGFESFTQEGVYSMMVGPNFETVSEARFLQIIGVDATGKILLRSSMFYVCLACFYYSASCVCVCASVRAFECVCVRLCERACVCVRVSACA